MRRIALLVLLAGLAAPAFAEAQMPISAPGKFGLGLGGGSVASGLSGKYYLSDNLAAQAAIGSWGWVGFGGFGASVDVLFEQASFWNPGPGALGWYYGAGGNVVLASGSSFGVSGVAGLNWQFSQFPLDVTWEYRPTFMVGNALYTGFDFWNFGGAIRYWF